MFWEWVCSIDFGITLATWCGALIGLEGAGICLIYAIDHYNKWRLGRDMWRKYGIRLF